MARRKHRRHLAWKQVFADTSYRMVCKACGRLATIAGAVKVLAEAKHHDITCHGCGGAMTKIESRCKA